MKANAYLNEVLIIAGPLIDASNATFIDLTDRLGIGRREGRPWFIYVGAKEPHGEVKPFERISDALGYLLGDDGRALLKTHGIEWPLIRLPEAVRSDLPPYVHGSDSRVEPGVYAPLKNPLGALFLRATNGHNLGIKPDEFEWVLTRRVDGSGEAVRS